MPTIKKKQEHAALKIVYEGIQEHGFDPLKLLIHCEVLACATVGNQGDARVYGPPMLIRIEESDGKWPKFNHDILAKISTRITNEIVGITRVVYDITNRKMLS